MTENNRITYPILNQQIDLDAIHRAANQIRKNAVIDKSSPLERIATDILQRLGGDYMENLIRAVLNYRVQGTELWIAFYSVSATEYEVLLERCVEVPDAFNSMKFRFSPPEDQTINLKMVLEEIKGQLMAKIWMLSGEWDAVDKLLIAKKES